MADEQFRSDLVKLLPRLRRFAAGLARSVAHGDDLVQGACERALQRSHQFQPGTRMDSWLYRIIHRLWLDQVQDLRRERTVGSDLPDAGEDGRPRVEASLTLAAVRRAMAELPEEQRAVMLLVCVEGQSYREAAEVLQVPIGTVMSRLARGRLALHERLEAGRGARGNVVKLG